MRRTLAMTESTRPPQYRSYLLRFWRENLHKAADDARTVWRFSLEDPRSGRRLGFADFEQLAAFLREQMSDEIGSTR